jgi:hypothetical protein
MSLYRTPGTAITWSTLSGWIAGAFELEHRGIRRCSRLVHEQLDNHWQCLAHFPEWIRQASEAELLQMHALLRRPHNAGHPWGKPHRGARRGTQWEIINQAVTDRLAQIKRRRDLDDIPDGPNMIAARNHQERISA